MFIFASSQLNQHNLINFIKNKMLQLIFKITIYQYSTV